jgi:hypothetical protein
LEEKASTCRDEAFFASTGEGSLIMSPDLVTASKAVEKVMDMGTAAESRASRAV